MEHRSGPVAARLTIALLLGLVALPAVRAETPPDPAREAEWAARLQQAGELRREGEARKAAAEQRYAEDEAACFKTLLVNRCRDEAKRRRIPEVNEARRLETEGKLKEQEVHKEQFADREARHQADAPQREADQRQHGAEAAARERETAARIDSRQRDKAQKAAEGAKRRAEREAASAKKQSDHAARVAEKQRAAEERDAAGGR